MTPSTNDSRSDNSRESRSDHKSAVLAATNIVELIGKTVALKRRGKDYLGLCPFHNEKTPSFHVNPTKQYYRCFGCKEWGDAITFVMKRDRIEFIDALKLLGESAGIEMPRYGATKEKASERQLLLEANSAACAFFEKLLASPEGAAGREYLRSRGFNAESVKRFQIGLAPNAWDGLLRSPLVKKFTPQLLLSAGLAKARENGNGFYDTFRDRLMFPIRDENGRIIAFGGRVMPGSEDKAKYLNSPETPLFNKSRSIFGLDLARQKIVESKTVAVVEGYTDVVMAHQYGATNVVSPLGTALTSQHVEMLRRFADRIVLLFDADTAGDKAVDRAVELFLTQPIEIGIASMPDGVDPDEYLLEHGTEAFEKLLSNAADALTYKWKQLARQFTTIASDLTGQQKAVQQYMELLASARGSGPVDSLRWGSALSRVSRLTEIPVEELNRRFRNVGKPAQKPTAQPWASGEEKPPAPVAPIKKGPLTARDRAERWILGTLLMEPGRWHDVQQHVAVNEFSDDARRQLAEAYWQHQRDEGEPVFNEFLGSLKDPAVSELAIELVEEAEGIENLEQRLNDAVNHLNEMRTRIEEKKTLAELRRNNDATQPEQDQIALLKKLQEQARRPDLRRVGS